VRQRPWVSSAPTGHVTHWGEGFSLGRRGCVAALARGRHPAAGAVSWASEADRRVGDGTSKSAPARGSDDRRLGADVASARRRDEHRRWVVPLCGGIDRLGRAVLLRAQSASRPRQRVRGSGATGCSRRVPLTSRTIEMPTARGSARKRLLPGSAIGRGKPSSARMRSCWKTSCQTMHGGRCAGACRPGFAGDARAGDGLEP